jgi:ectoine hydroxylase-related dioxygenase (phytanoyl-CoA dioxygenase family)
VASLSTDDLRAAYQRDGYVRIPRVVSEDQLAAMQGEADRLVTARPNTLAWRGKWRKELAYAEPKVEYTLTTVAQVHEDSPLFDAVLRRGPLTDVVRALIGGAVDLEQSMLIVKPPVTGQPFPLHQDSAYYAKDEPRYCIAMLHLDATTAENGALRILRGGHSHGHLPHLEGKQVGKAHLDPRQYSMDGAVEVSAGAGDVVCMSIYAPHASLPNRSQQARRLLRAGYVPLR